MNKSEKKGQTTKRAKVKKSENKKLRINKVCTKFVPSLYLLCELSIDFTTTRNGTSFFLMLV